MDAKKKEVTTYYKENIPHLETQLKYEELLRTLKKHVQKITSTNVYCTKMCSK